MRSQNNDLLVSTNREVIAAITTPLEGADIIEQRYPGYCDGGLPMDPVGGNQLCDSETGARLC